MMKTNFKTNFFPHDFTASTDLKIVRLESKKGLEGYAIYFKIIEQLHISNGQLEYDIESLAYVFRYDDLELIESVLNDFDLFQINKNVITSSRVNTQLNKIVEASNIGKENAIKGHNKTRLNKLKEEIVKLGALKPKYCDLFKIEPKYFEVIMNSFNDYRKSGERITLDYIKDNYIDDLREWSYSEVKKGRFSSYKIKKNRTGEL